MPEPITRDEFISRLRTRYPQYDGLEDADLFDRVLARYPQYRAVIADAPAEPAAQPDDQSHLEGLQPEIRYGRRREVPEPGIRAPSWYEWHVQPSVSRAKQLAGAWLGGLGKMSGAYFKHGEDAFKWFASGMPEDHREIERIERSDWFDIAKHTYPQLEMDPEGEAFPEFVKYMAADSLGMAGEMTKPSSWFMLYGFQKVAGAAVEKALSKLPATWQQALTKQRSVMAAWEKLTKNERRRIAKMTTEEAAQYILDKIPNKKAFLATLKPEDRGRIMAMLRSMTGASGYQPAAATVPAAPLRRGLRLPGRPIAPPVAAQPPAMAPAPAVGVPAPVAAVAAAEAGPALAAAALKPREFVFWQPSGARVPQRASVVQVLDDETTRIWLSDEQRALDVPAAELQRPGPRERQRSYHAALKELPQAERAQVKAASKEFDDLLKDSSLITQDEWNEIDAQPGARARAMSLTRALGRARREAVTALGEPDVDTRDPRERARLLPALRERLAELDAAEIAAEERWRITKRDPAPIVAAELSPGDEVYHAGQWHAVQYNEETGGVTLMPAEGMPLEFDVFDTVDVAGGEMGVISTLGQELDRVAEGGVAYNHEAQAPAEAETEATKAAARVSDEQLALTFTQVGRPVADEPKPTGTVYPTHDWTVGDRAERMPLTYTRVNADGKPATSTFHPPRAGYLKLTPHEEKVVNQAHDAILEASYKTDDLIDQGISVEEEARLPNYNEMWIPSADPYTHEFQPVIDRSYNVKLIEEIDRIDPRVATRLLEHGGFEPALDQTPESVEIFEREIGIDMPLDIQGAVSYGPHVPLSKGERVNARMAAEGAPTEYPAGSIGARLQARGVVREGPPDQWRRAPIRSQPWPEDFPLMQVHTSVSHLTRGANAPDHQAAKHGDYAAATRLVQKVIKPDKIAALKAAHPDAIVAGVLAVEETGANMLPIAYMAYLEEAGFRTAPDIIQSNVAAHTRRKARGRLYVTPEYEGPVEAGAGYVLVDDAVTTGSTLAALAGHIERGGGRVVSVLPLARSRGSMSLAPTSETLELVRQKLVDMDGLNAVLSEHEIAASYEYLTEAQLRWLARHQSVDTIRTSLAETAGAHLYRQVPPASTTEARLRLKQTVERMLGAPPPQAPPPQTATELPPISRKQIVDRLSAKLQALPIRIGGFRSRGAPGAPKRAAIFKPAERTIRTAEAHKIDDMSHEVGHDLFYRLGWNEPKALTDAEMSELEALGKEIYPEFVGVRLRSEGMAEYVRRWMFGEPVETMAPELTRRWVPTLEANPEVKAALEEARLGIAHYSQQGAHARADALIVEPETKPHDPATPFGRIRSTLLHLQEALQDQYAFLSEFERQMRAAPVISKSPTQTAYLMSGEQARAEQWLQVWGSGQRRFSDWAVIGPSWGKIVAPVLPRAREFMRYELALHTLSGRLPAGKPTGILRSDAEQIVQDLESPEFRQAHEQLVQYRQNLAQYAQDAGLYARGTVRRWAQQYPDYVATYRLMEAAELAHGAKTGPAGLRPIKRAKGSMRPIINPLVSDIQMTYSIHRAAELNRVLRNIVDMARSTPGAGVWVENVAKPLRPVKVNVDEVKAYLKKHEVELPAAEEGDIVDTLTVFRPQLFAPAGTVGVWEDGTLSYYFMQPDLLRAVQHLTGPEADLALKLMHHTLGLPVRTLKAGITLHPRFWVRNKVRDSLAGWVNNDFTSVLLLDHVFGVFQALGKGALYNDYLSSGAAYSTFSSGDIMERPQVTIARLAGRGKLEHLATHPLQTAALVSEKFELAGRVGEFGAVHRKTKFDTALDKIMAAGRQAQEAMINFSKIGWAARYLNRMTAFFNPAVQGTVRTVQALTGVTNVRHVGPDAPHASRGRKAFATWAKALGSVTIFSLANYLRNRNDPDYWELDPRTRDLYWPVKLPTLRQDGAYFLLIPKPFEIGTLFGSVPERIFAFIDSRDPAAFDELGTSLHEIALPGLLPTALVPPAEHYANKSLFWQTPLYPQYQEGMRGFMRARPSNTELVKAVAQGLYRTSGGAIDISPAVLENYVRGWTGTLGIEGLQLLDTELQRLGALPKKATQPADPTRTPVVGGFVRDAFAFSHSLQRFYDQAANNSEVYRTAHRLLTEDPQEARRFVGTHRRQMLLSGQTEHWRALAHRHGINPTDFELRKWLAAMRQRREQILESPLDPRTKQERVNRLNRDMARRCRLTLESRAGLPTRP